MTLRFVPFDGSQAHYALTVAVHNSFWTTYPQTIVERRVLDETRDAHHERYRWLLYRGANLVGLADFGRAEWARDSNKFEFIIIILPPFRRRGYGTSALRFATDFITSRHPVSVLESEANTLDPAGITFLKKLGFSITTHEIASCLDLADFKPAEIKSTPGIQHVSYAELERNNADFWPRLYDLHVTLERDVPWHDEVIIEPLEYWKQRRMADPRLLMDSSFVALDRGQYVGASELFHRTAQDTYLHTGLTGVLASLRRRGIATALKQHSLIWARTHLQTSSGAPFLVLAENEVNNPMFTLNQILGFSKLFELYYFAKDINTSPHGT